LIMQEYALATWWRGRPGNTNPSLPGLRETAKDFMT
jgi:hypothetical protein